MNVEEFLLLVPVLLGLKFNIWVLLEGRGGAGVASLWCKCCANVVVPLVTDEGQTRASSAYLVLGRDHSPSLCLTEPLTTSSVHIIKILHMKTSVFLSLNYLWLLSNSTPAGRVSMGEVQLFDFTSAIRFEMSAC